MDTRCSPSLQECAAVALLVVSIPSALRADAIFPTLLLFWPLTVLLFIPAVLIETLYARKRLEMSLGQCLRVVTTANLLSAVAGLPIATAVSRALQYAMEAVYFRDGAALKQRAIALHMVEPDRLRAHDTVTLMWLGIYPRWIMLLSAAVLITVCFLISWWVEGKWIERHLRRISNRPCARCSVVARNANILSYALVVSLFLLALVKLWPIGVNTLVN